MDTKKNCVSGNTGTESNDKRHAYLILAHHRFGQLRKLIMLLDDPRNDIFVHVDKKAAFNPDEWTGLCRHSRLSFLKERICVSWGGVSIMRSELALLKEATSSGEYDYYHLLSGMDLPIKDQDTIHAFFDAHSGTEFINFWHFKKTTASRFHYYTLFPEGAGHFATNLINNIFKGLQMAVGYKMNKDVDFRFASQWFSITDELARYVISKEEWLEKVFRHTNTCDEIFLATLVWNSPFREKLYVKEPVDEHVVNESNMRFIDWTRGESIRHPWTFRISDWDLLMSVPHFWARKFDENVDNEIIEKICSALMPKS